MDSNIYINSLTFTEDTELRFSDNDIVVFVGANNAGKSLAMKEIAAKVRNNDFTGKIIKEVSLQTNNNFDQILQFVKSNSLQKGNSEIDFSFAGYNYEVHYQTLKGVWENLSLGLSDVSNLLVKIVTTEERLTISNPAININTRTEIFQHPIHFLQGDESIECKFSCFFKRAFGKELIVHKNNGQTVPLYVGSRPSLNEGEDRVSERYLSEVEMLDLLHEQGDGVRSFVGLMLSTLTSNASILFIDEPELFLHPPQAKLIGKVIAAESENVKQFFFATHSEDFLRGILDIASARIKVVRLRRDNDSYSVNVLNADQLKEVWTDPILKYSNILAGLFHSKVVVCESDSDSKFYSAVLEAVIEVESLNEQDVLFVNVGGKSRLNVVVKAFSNLKVPIKVIADFDILNSSDLLKTLYLGLGGNWNDIKEQCREIKVAIDQKAGEFPISEAQAEIQGVFNSITGTIFTKDAKKEIENIIKKVKPWTEAKKLGKAYLDDPNLQLTFDQLQIKFRNVGLLIPDIGEIESFVPSIQGHGPKWTNEVLKSKDLKEDSELENARQFVRQILQ